METALDLSSLKVFFFQGQLESGQVFDTSRKAGREPFSVQLGAGQVIQGRDLERRTTLCAWRQYLALNM